MKLPFRFAALLALAIAATAAVRAASAPEPKPGTPVPAGDVRGEVGVYGVVFYYAPKPAADPRATAQKLIERFLPGVALVDIDKNEPKAPCIGFTEEQAPLKNFSVPESPYFETSGQGLTAEDIAAFQKTDRATQLVLVAPRDQVWTLGRKFTALVHEFATATNAYLWDSTTRECFSRDAWKTKRLASWPEEGVPDLRDQITIHLYRPEEKSTHLRAVTLGMEKFALPDIVIERVIASDNRPAGNLINLVCQSFAEWPTIPEGSNLTFDIERLKTQSLRSDLEKSLKKGAQKQAPLAILVGQRQQGDADNALLEIDFRHGAGKTEDERRQSILATIWGAEESVTNITHNEEILAASRRAMKRLLQLRGIFEKGLAPGERLMVKAPFPRDDKGNEWMWVEVVRWPVGETLDGVLQNDPFYIRDLKAGAPVKIKVREIFDYLYYRKDGTSEGNETGKLIEKLGAPVIEK